MKHILIIAITAATMLMSSCASQRALRGDVQAVSAKIDAHIKAFQMNEGCNGSIKMKRGEAIQISLTKYGIEGARIIMTPDSLLVINKMSKTYLRTSFKDADRALGGEGMLTFRNIEAYFWNENGKNTQYASIPVAGFLPLELKTTFGRRVQAGDQHLPQRITIDISGGDGAIEAGEAKLKLSKVQAANSWAPNTTIPSNYKNLNVISTIKKLLKK